MYPNFPVVSIPSRIYCFIFLLRSDWCDVCMTMLNWVVGRHLSAKVKMDGAVRYGFGLDSDQSVHKDV
jgi:hypothetical protein